MLKKNFRKSTIVDPAADSQQWSESADPQKVCELQNGCYFPSAFQISQEPPLLLFLIEILGNVVQPR